MDISYMSQGETIIFALLVGAGIGFVLGLVPFIAGMIKRRFKYGILGLVCSVVVSPIGVILSVLVCTIFTWLIFRRSSEPAMTPADQK